MTEWHPQPADQDPDQTPTSLVDSRDHHIVEIAGLDAQQHVNDVATPASTSISLHWPRSRLRQMIIMVVIVLAMVVGTSILWFNSDLQAPVLLENGDEYVTAALQRELLAKKHKRRSSWARKRRAEREKEVLTSLEAQVRRSDVLLKRLEAQIQGGQSLVLKAQGPSATPET